MSAVNSVSTFAGSGVAGSGDATGTSASFNTPFGVAVDASGIIYVADYGNHKIRKITSAGVVSTLAGSILGATDATGTSASFANPTSVAVDATGNVFVADYGNNKIRKITSAGVVTTFAGNGTVGSTNATGTSATFNHPSGVAIDASGNLYVADFSNNKIRKISSAGVVTTLAGSGTAGSTDATGTAATFTAPISLALDASGNLFITEQTGNKIRKITPAGVVTTVAGSGTAGSTDATGTLASFNHPSGIVVDASGNIYVAEQTNNKIRKITSAGVVTTLAGSATAGSTDAVGTAATFTSPCGIALDIRGNLFVADFGNNKIRKIVAVPYSVSPSLPAGLSLNSATGVISGTPTTVVPATNYTITATNGSGSGTAIVNITVKPSNDATLVALSLSSGTLSPVFASATISYTASVSNATTSITVTPTVNQPNATVKVNGTAVTSGSASGAITLNLGINTITTVVTAQDGTTIKTYTITVTRVSIDATLSNLAISSVSLLPAFASATISYTASVSNAISSITVTPTVNQANATVTVNGTTVTSGSASGAIALSVGGNTVNTVVTAQDGSTTKTYTTTITRAVSAPSISYSTPQTYTYGVTISSLSPVNSGGAVSAVNSVSTFAGSGTAGSTDAMGPSATFNNPLGVAIDASGNIYVGDYSNNKIRKITSAGVVTTLAGSGILGSTDATGTSASFRNPAGVALDASGNIYLADYSNNKIRKITSAGVVTTLAGNGTAGSIDATGTNATFNGPAGVAVDASGNVYVADYGNNKIRKITPAGVVTTFAGSGTVGSTDATGTAASFTGCLGLALDASGNVYVAEYGNNKIRKISSSAAVVTTLAGSGSAGSTDATGIAASFNGPAGVALDASGNIYVADQNNNTIRKITSAGVVTTLAGSGTAGSTDATGTSASFSRPYGVATDASQNLYVGDYSNNKIRKIIAVPYRVSPSLPAGLSFSSTTGVISGTPTTVASATNYTITATNGSGSGTAIVNITVNPSNDATLAALSISSGTLSPVFASATTNYTASVSNATTSITVSPTVNQPNATVKVNGTAVTSGSASGAITLSVGSNTINTVITAQDGTTIKVYTITVTRISVDATLSNLAISSGSLSSAFASATTSYTASVSNAISSITVTPTVNQVNATVTVNGTAVTSGSASGAIALTVGGNTIATIATAQDGSTIKTYTITVTRATFAPSISYSTPQIYTFGVPISPLSPGNSGGAVSAVNSVSTFAGNGTVSSTNATGTSASFWNPGGVAIDASGNIYVADYSNNKIRKITSAGVVTTLAGNGTAGSIDATGTNATFNGPVGLAVDASGNVYVADVANHKIRKITPAGAVTTLAGSGTAGSVDATGTSASFNRPDGVAVDALGNVYVSDYVNNKIRKVTPGGVVTTFAGSNTPGYSDGTGTAAKFNLPLGVGLDVSGNLYVADGNNNMIRKITSAGVVTTLAGSGVFGSTDAIGTSASFNNPTAVAVDASGNVYVADQANNKIRIVTSAGVVTTLAGNGTIGSIDATGTSASFNTPSGVALDASGVLYVGDNGNNKIRKIVSVPYNVTPALPAGLSLSSTTGVISGTPTSVTAATNYTVTAANETGSATAIVNITVKPSNDATLVSLTLSSGTLSPTFAPGTTGYTASVSNGISSITVTPTVNQPNATVKVNGTAVASGSASGAISLSVGSNTITTIVTAQDGSTKTYTIAVCQAPATPIITAGGATTFCSGGSVTLTSASATGNQWYKGGVAINTATSQNYTATAAGSYTVVVTISGCSSATSAATVVAVNPLPTASISGTTTICSSATAANITFTGTSGTTPYTFTYKINTGGNFTVTTVSGNSVTVAAPTTAGNFVYTLISVQDASSTTCSQTQGGTATVTVNATPATPTINAGSATTFCAGASVTLTSSSATGNQWYSAGLSLISGAIGNTYTATIGGSYTVIVTSNGCSSSPATFTAVTVNPLPTATISGSTTLCQSATSPDITFTGAGGTAPYTFTYNLNGGSNQTVTSTAGSSVTVPALTTSAGSFVYTLLSVQDASSTTCSQTQSGSATVTVNATPATPTISGSTSFCTQGNTALTSSSATGNQWYLNGNPISGATGNVYGATTAGSYTVVVTTSGCSSAASAAIVTSEQAFPTISISPSSTTICNGSSVSLTATTNVPVAISEGFNSGTGINPYTPTGWAQQNNSTVVGTTGWFNNDINRFPSHSGSGYIAANYNNTVGANTISNWLITPSVTISNGAIFTFYTRASSVVFAERLQLRMSTNGTSTSVGTASTEVGDFTTLLVDINPTLTPSGYPTTWVQYSVTISGVATPVTGRFAFRHFVTNGGPGGSNSEYIGIDDVLYSAPQITWTPSASLNASTGGVVSATPTGATTYTATVTVNGCATSATSTVALNPKPTATISGTTAVCQNGTSPSIIFTGAGATAPYTFTYSLNGGSNQTVLSTSGNSATLSVPTSAVGSFAYTLLNVRDASATTCSQTQSGTATVTVNATPATPTISGSGSFCTGGSSVLTSSSATGNQWYLNGGLLSGSTSQTYNTTASGSYTVIVTTNGCSSSVSSATIVTMNAIPSTPNISAGGATTFCSGGSITLTSSSTTGNQWYIDGSVISGATSQTYDATVSGSYTVIVTTNSCSSAASAPTAVTVNSIPATPTISAGGAVIFCSGGNVTLTSSSATGNQWYKDGSIISGATSTTYTASTGGSYTVNATTLGCSSPTSAATVVTVNAIPSTPTITAGGATIFCSGGSVALTSSSATGNQWYSAGLSLISGATGNTYTATAGGSYTVIVTTNGCSSGPATFAAVTVNPLPTATISGTTSTCSSATAANITFTGAGGTPPYTFTYNINTGGSLTVTTVSGNSVTVAAPTTIGSFVYTLVSVQDASSTTCSQTQNGTATVTVNATPATPTISGAATFCTGGSTVLTSSSTTGNQWYLAGSPISGGTGNTYTATTAGSYTIGATANGCSSATSAATVVNVNASPAISITPSSATICSGTSVSLTAITTEIGEGFNSGPATGPYTPTGWAQQNNSTVTGTTRWFKGRLSTFASHSGSGYIAADFNNTLGTNTISNWLITPSVTISNGAVFTFYSRASGGNFPDRLQLRMSTNGTSTNVGTGSTAVGDFTTLLVDINPTLTTTGYPTIWTKYSVTISGVATPVTGRFAFRYFVTNGGPNGANSFYIGIDDVQYSGAQISWTPSASLNTNTGSVVSATPTQTTTYTATATLNGCSTQAASIITVNPLPTATISGTTTVCQNDASPSITFTGAGGTAPYTFTYRLNGGANQTVTSTVGSSATLSAPTSAAGSFVYTLISVRDASSTTCSQTQSGSATVTVNAIPTTPTISGTASFCTGGSTVLTSSSPTDNQWYSAGNPISGETGNTYTVTAAGSYTVVVMPGGCSFAASAPTTIIENALPTVSVISSNATICAGSSTTLTASGATNYIWSYDATVTAGTGAGLAVGMRKLNSSYSGNALRIRRSTDNVESDFGFTGMDLNTAAIASFLNGAAGYVTTLYDQSGSGNDVVQTTAASQPLYVANGINSRPVLQFSTSQFMANNTNFPAPFTVVYGARQTGPNRGRVLSTVNGNWLLGWWNGARAQAYYEGWVSPSGTPAADNNAYVYTGSSNGSTADIYENGTLVANNGGGVSGPNGIRLNGSGYGEPSDAEFFDVIVYNTVLTSSVRQAIENGIMGYHTTSTNPLVVSPAATTTYTLTGTDASGCSNTASTIVTVNAIPGTPTITPAGTTVICSGSSVTLTSSSASGNQWYLDSIPISLSANATCTATLPGDYTVVVTTNGCSSAASAATTLTVTPLPTASISGNNSPACLGSAAIFTITGTSGAVVSYNIDGGTLSTVTLTDGTANVTINNTTSNTTLNLTSITDGTCSQNLADSSTVGVNALPTVSASSSDAIICDGASTNLTASGANTYIWNTDVTVTGAALAVGMRKIYSSYSGNAMRIRRSTDNVESDFGFMGNDLNTNAIATFLNGAPGYVTTLYDQSGTGNDVVQATAGSQPLYVANGINGRTVLRFTSSQSMANNTNFPAPFAVVYGARQTGPARARALSSVNNNWLLGWWNGAKAQAYYEGWVSPVQTPAADNNAYVYSGNSNGSTSEVYENGTLIASNSGGVTGPDGIRLNGVGGGAGSELSDVEFFDVIVYNSVLATATRQSIEGNMMLYYTIPNSNNPQVVSPNTTTTYIVTGTDASGCSNTDSVTVTVNPAPVTTVGSNSPVCGGSAINLTSSGGASYNWIGPNSFISTQQNPVINNATSAMAGTYSVTVTGENNCSSITSATVTIYAQPVVTTTATQTCYGRKATLNASTSLGSISWYASASGGSPLGTGSTFTTPILTSSTTYYAAASNGPSTNTLQTTFSVANSQSTSGNMFNITATNNTILINSFDIKKYTSTNFFVRVYYRAGGYNGYENNSGAWTFLGSATAFGNSGTPVNLPVGGLTIPIGETYGIFITTASTSNYLVYTNGANTYSDANITINTGTANATTASFFFSNAFSTAFSSSTWNGRVNYSTTGTGCTSQFIPATATVNPVPAVNAGSDVTICAGASANLTGGGATTYVWSNNAPVTAGSGARLAVGMRKLNSFYSGNALRIRRSTDNVESDFGFIGNDLNTAAISTFLNGAPGYVTTLYDQSGSGNHVVQATAASQPLYIASGINGRPLLRFTTSQYMSRNTNFAAPFTVVYGARQTGPNRSRVLSSINNTWILGWWNGARAQAYYGGWVSPVGTPAANNNAYVYTGSSNGSVSQIYENGTLMFSNSGGVTGPNGIRLNGGGPGSGTELSDAEFFDVIVYNLVLTTAARQSVENGMMQYYTTSTNPLVVSPAATTAYTVTGTNTGGCSNTSSVTVTVNPLAGTPTITAGSATTFCNGGTVTLTSSSTTGNQWYKNGNAISGETSNSYIATTAGSYTVTVTGANGCSSAASSPTTVTVNPIPATPNITSGGATTFCDGGSVTLTSSSTTGNQWYNDGNAIGGATFNTYTATASGNYTVIVTTNDCSSAASTAITLTANAIPATPTITEGGATTFCDGGTVTLTSSSTTGNQWYTDGNAISGETSNTYNAATTGSYTVIVTTSGCPSDASSATTVTVNTIPATPTITSGGATIFCIGGSVTLTSSSASGNQWYKDGNAISGETSNTYSATTSGNYTVIVTTSGCSSAASFATTVATNPIPAIPSLTAGGATTFCSGDSVTFTSSSTSGNQWYKDGNALSGQTSDTYSAAATGSYTVVVTALGCSSAASAAATVTVNPLPTANISGNNGPICSGGIASFTVTGTSGATVTYNIDGSTLTTIPITGGSGSATVSVGNATSNTTLNILSVTDGTCSQALNGSSTVAVNVAPSAMISYDGSPYCANGGTATVTRTGTAGGTYSSSTGLSIDPNTGDITPGTSTAGTYTVTYTIAAGGGCAQFSINTSVTIVNPTNLSISYAGGPFCQTGNNMVTRTGVAGGSYSSDAGISVNASSGTIFPAASTAGVHTITYSVNFPTGCTSSAITTVTIVPTPTITLGTVPTICFSAIPSTARLPYTATTGSPATYSITADTTNPMPNYVPVTDASLPGSPIPVIVPAGTPGGIYYFDLHVTSANGCISPGRYVFKVTVASQATISIVYNGSPFCNTGVAGVSQMGATGGTYMASSAALSVNATTGLINLGSSQTGDYTVKYILSINGCGYTTTAPVTITGLPTITPGSAPALCFSATASTALLSYTATTGNPTTYSLSVGTLNPMPGFTPVLDATLPASPISIAIPAGTAGGTYTFDLRVKNAQGCSSPGKYVVSVTIVGSNTTISYNSGQPACQTGVVLVTLSGASGGTYTSDANLNINSNTGTVYPASSTLGTHTVTYTLVTANCTFSTTTDITIVPLPKVTIGTIAPVCVSANAQTVSVPYTVTASAPVSYSITVGATNPMPGYVAVTDAALGNAIIVNIRAGTAAGTYSFYLTLKSAGGCVSAKYTFFVSVKAMPTATMAYTNSPYSTTVTAAAVSFSGTAGGTYSSTTGLHLNATTGSVFPSTSTPGTYTVTYTVTPAANCTATTTTQVTIFSPTTPRIVFTSTPGKGTTATKKVPVLIGIEETITVAPNPVEHRVKAQVSNFSDPMQIRLMDATGKEILSTTRFRASYVLT